MEDSRELLKISDPTEVGRRAAASVHFEIRNRGDIDQAMDLGLTASPLELVENLGGALDDISEAAIKAIVEGARLVKDEAFFAARAGLDEFGPSLGFEPDSIAFLHGGLKSAEGLADGVLNLISFSAGFAITAAKSVLEGVVALPGAVVDISSAIADLTFSMVELGPGKTYDNLKAQAVVFFDGFQKTVVEQTEVWLKKYEKANEQQRQAMLGGLVARILELLLGAVAGAKALARTAVTAKRVGVAGVSKAKARVGRGGGVDGRPRGDGDAVLERRSELEPRRKAELETAMEAGTGNKAYDTIPESAKKAELEFLEDGPVKRESFTDGDGNKYDAVVELPNGHRFRRGKDGRWCRFSTKKASVCVVGRSSFSSEEVLEQFAEATRGSERRTAADLGELGEVTERPPRVGDSHAVARQAARDEAGRLSGSLSAKQRKRATVVAAIHDPETGRTIARTNIDARARSQKTTHPLVLARIGAQKGRVELARANHGNRLTDTQLRAELRRRGLPDSEQSVKLTRRVQDRVAFFEARRGGPMREVDWDGMADEVGTHAEVAAFSDILNARDAARVRDGLLPTTEAELGNLSLHNQRLTKSDAPLADSGMPRCDHCQAITDGVEPSPSLAVVEEANRAKDAARREEGR